ncbi:MAG: response regulator transcription factor [Lactobacillaceae bacterium]|jgi:DNA-binding response OmpR family regulator|nr:response regulator transcription factor [Lactobacillaceae bacterium]
MDKRILVVDDDDAIRRGIKIYLEQAGYIVAEAENGQVAIDLVQQTEFHLVVMDIMMPVMDGIKASAWLRQAKYNMPILMLSAKSEDFDKINGLSNGADDYITKPFTPMELVARVNSLLRRFMDFGEYVKPSANVIIVGGLVLDKEARSVEVDGQRVKLTPKEFQIIELLMAHAGRVYSIDEIYELVWQEPAYQADNTVSVHIRKIREKIEANPKHPMYLKVVWGVGYKIEKY